MMRADADLERLHELCTLSPGLLAGWIEAAAVMLDKFHPVPPPPTTLTVHDDGDVSTFSLAWPQPSPTMMASHANEKDATEQGAYGIAVAAVHQRGYRVRRRTHQGSGADLLMVRHGEPDTDFVKLEVSGIARGATLSGRLGVKAEQVAGGDLRRPGVAVVVGFEAAAIRLASVP